MSKQKLADMVMLKMLQKKQKEQKNRPHYEVLQLFVKFDVEDCRHIQKEIEQLTEQIKIQGDILLSLEQKNLAFENSGKKVYPRIIIKPQFIASQHVQPQIKEFYRKASNTFLREDLLKKKQFQLDSEKVEKIKAVYEKLWESFKNVKEIKQAQRVKTNQKRVRNLKEDLRRRAIKQQQEQLKNDTEDEKLKHKDLLKQYELKKTNLNKREDWAKELIKLIDEQKKLIEKTYNPISYRDYLKKVYSIRTKNQYVSRNLLEIGKIVNEASKNVSKRRIFLELNDNLYVQGKSSNSPTKTKRFSSQPSAERPRTTTAKESSLLSSLKKSVVLDAFQTPKKTLTREKSYSTSVGKTTASSMTNLLKNSRQLMKKGISMSTQLKKQKMIFN